MVEADSCLWSHLFQHFISAPSTKCFFLLSHRELAVKLGLDPHFPSFQPCLISHAPHPEQMKLLSWNDHTHQKRRKNGSWSGPPRTTPLLASLLSLFSSEHHQFDFWGKVLCSFWPHLTAERSWPPLSPTPSKFCLDWCCLSHDWAPQSTGITCQQPEVWAHREGWDTVPLSQGDICLSLKCRSTSLARHLCQVVGCTGRPGEGVLWQWTWGCGRSEGQSDLIKAAALREHFWGEHLEFRNAFQDGMGMDHLFQDMDWDASLACDSPLRSSSFYVGRVRDPVVEQSTAEHLHIHCLRHFKK